jgi:hypothetical protein
MPVPPRSPGFGRLADRTVAVKKTLSVARFGYIAVDDIIFFSVLMYFA